MPFGFWVLGNAQGRKNGKGLLRSSLKCLSAFGFWGTPGTTHTAFVQFESQMPFGFWVLGDCDRPNDYCHAWNTVSNAFRLLGSGGREEIQTELNFGN